ncbi:hypothetical protein AURDEDRAFT_116326 [Auricularia subglabra TFB-10046 SS5]|nr:hypothetical protein AURDEDRAFT_116326 [Auricularia subglabra TFB-10046 SS5]
MTAGLRVALGVALSLQVAAHAVKVHFPTNCTEPAPTDPAQPLPTAWIDPRLDGGQMLDSVFYWRIGEPLNVIISGQSDREILTESGFVDYARSIGFSDECLGLHMGMRHQANLGDGLGWREEQLLERQTFRTSLEIPLWGTTCWESLAGGNHFRAWRQDTTGAWFLAASEEMSGRARHMIVEDGYNRGRDSLVAKALSSSRHSPWVAEVAWIQGLLEPGAEGINHKIPQDGLVALLTVTKRPNKPPRSRRFWPALMKVLHFLLPFF